MQSPFIRGAVSGISSGLDEMWPYLMQRKQEREKEEERQRRLDQAVAAARRFYPDADPEEIRAAIQLHLAGIPQGLRIIDSRVGAEERQQAFDELIEDVPDKLKGYFRNRWEITGGASGGGKADVAFQYQLQTEDEKQELVRDAETLEYLLGKNGLVWNPKPSSKITKEDAQHLSRYRQRFGVDAYNKVRDQMVGEQVDKEQVLLSKVGNLEWDQLTTKDKLEIKKELGLSYAEQKKFFHAAKEDKLSFRDIISVKQSIMQQYQFDQSYVNWRRATGEAREHSRFQFFNDNFNPGTGEPKIEFVRSEINAALNKPEMPDRIYQIYDSVRIHRAGKSLEQIRKDIVRARRTGTGAFGLSAKYFVGLTNDEIDMILERFE